MSLTRRRSDRPGPAMSRRGSLLEELESRQLLSGSNASFYNPDDLPNSVKPGNVPTPVISHPIGIGNQTLANLGDQGKSVTGRDRNGNVWTITVYGPGQVIVNDVTNDGVLDDDISTIQLIGTDPNKTHVIGQVTASQTTLTALTGPLQSTTGFDSTTFTPIVNQLSAQPQVVAPSGQVLFNQLIAQQGVASIVLNGFILTQTLTPANGIPNSGTGIFLPGGVRNLSFTAVDGLFDTSQSPAPIDITIGQLYNPLRFKPTIRIDAVYNTVFDSSTLTVPTVGPQTTPTVALIVNGQIHSLQLGSVGQLPEPASDQYLFPVVGSSGRTSIQTTGLDNLVVSGSATNFTVSKAAEPFSSPTSGVSHIGSATFGGNADALGLDVNGPIGTLEFAAGLGSPVGLNVGALDSGIPFNQYGFPASGLLGGLVSGTSIHSIVAAPANVTLVSSNNPLDQTTLPGFTQYFAKAGKTLNFSAITTPGSIGSVNVVGDSTQSEIKTGYSVNAAIAGQQATQGRTSIKNLRYRGDLVDSPISASYRPGTLGYGSPGSVAGPGSITGTFNGKTYLTGKKTALGNVGTGFFAKFKTPGLP
ncbi:MAG TPA: hypothetical protein VGH33_01735 [Isosphaeraceae bacterium]